MVKKNPQFLKLKAVLWYKVGKNYQKTKHIMKYNKSSFPQFISRSKL